MTYKADPEAVKQAFSERNPDQNRDSTMEETGTDTQASKAAHQIISSERSLVADGGAEENDEV